MVRRNRLGKGLEDISHYFISTDPKKDQKKKEDPDSRIVEGRIRCQIVSIVDLFDPRRGALLTSKIGMDLCKNGVRTLVIDADTRFPSIAFTLGLSIPGYSFRHYFKNQYQPCDIICTGPFGLKLLAPRLSIKDVNRMNMSALSPMIETLISIESDIDIIILRQYEGKLQPFIEEAIFIIPALHTAMVRAYRAIKSFIACGDKERIGIVISNTEKEITAMKVYERICRSIETYCGIRPYYYGYLSDITTFSISSIVSHIAEAEVNSRNTVKGKGSFFERLQYLIGGDNLTGEEIASLLSY